MDQTEVKDTHSHKGQMCCSGCCSCSCHGQGWGRRWLILLIGIVFAFIVGYKLGVIKGLVSREYLGPRGGWNMMYGTVQQIPESELPEAAQ